MESLLAIMLFLFYLAVVGWLIGYTIYAYLEEYKSRHLFGLLTFLALSLFFWAIGLAEQEQENVGPCIEEVTGTMYDPALKMVRTYTYCKQRGKWQD